MTKPKVKPKEKTIKDPFLEALWSGTADPHLPITEVVAAQFLNLSIATLSHWRSRGYEPPAWTNLQPEPSKRAIIRYPAGELRKLIERGMQRKKASPSLASAAPSTHASTMLKPSAEQAAAIQAVLEGAIPKGGRRKGVNHDSYPAFLATGRPDDEWVFAMVPSPLQGDHVRRPVDLISTLDLPPEELDDATCEQLPLSEYSKRLALYLDNFPRQEKAEKRSKKAGDGANLPKHRPDRDRS